MSTRAAQMALAALLCVTGCADDAPDETTSVTDSAAQAADSGAVPAADTSSGEALDAPSVPDASFEVTLGTGRNLHMPLVDGDTLHLELGHQGLQHVLVSIRLGGLPQARYYVDFLLERPDGVAVAGPIRIRLPFTELPDGSGSELVGYTLVVLEPALAVGHDAVLRVAVEGPEAGISVDERSVHVEWAPEGWNPDA